MSLSTRPLASGFVIAATATPVPSVYASSLVCQNAFCDVLLLGRRRQNVANSPRTNTPTAKLIAVNDFAPVGIEKDRGAIESQPEIDLHQYWSCQGQHKRSLSAALGVHCCRRVLLCSWSRQHKRRRKKLFLRTLVLSRHDAEEHTLTEQPWTWSAVVKYTK